MSERYILVTDDEYCYMLDAEAEDYKTLEDFEKAEFEDAKKDGIDIKEHEDEILQFASDKYWDWVYDAHISDTCDDIMNKLYDENKKLKELYQDTKRQLSELGGKSVAKGLNLRLCLQKKYLKCDTIGKELIKDIARELDIELEEL